MLDKPFSSGDGADWADTKCSTIVHDHPPAGAPHTTAVQSISAISEISGIDFGSLQVTLWVSVCAMVNNYIMIRICTKKLFLAHSITCGGSKIGMYANNCFASLLCQMEHFCILVNL